MISRTDWDSVCFHGRYNRWPFTEVVSFVMGTFGSVSDRKQIKVLDLGFGGAHHLLFLAEEGFDYFGIDGSQEALGIASSRLAKKGFPVEGLTLGQLDNLPYTDDFFDCVIDRGTLVCNRKRDLTRLISEARRVLKPGGWFFSMIINKLSTAKDGARDLGEGDFTNFPGRLSEAGVLHFTDCEEARELFGSFRSQKVDLLVRKSEYDPDGGADVDAWTIIICQN